jgi:hypothetical protein
MFVSSCSVLRTGREVNYLKETIESDNIVRNVRNNNITGDNIFVERAEIEYLTKEGSKRAISNIRYEKSGKFLVSLRTRSGIEIARVFGDNDTLVMIDRINGKEYCSTPEYVKRKYGFTMSFFPLIFGDYISDNVIERKRDDCNKGVVRIEGNIGNNLMEYFIDCKAEKILSVSKLNSGYKREMEIEYKKFTNVNGCNMPTELIIKNLNDLSEIKIWFKKITYPWDGKIRFTSGNDYEIVRLL